MSGRVKFSVLGLDTVSNLYPGCRRGVCVLILLIKERLESDKLFVNISGTIRSLCVFSFLDYGRTW